MVHAEDRHGRSSYSQTTEYVDVEPADLFEESMAGEDVEGEDEEGAVDC